MFASIDSDQPPGNLRAIYRDFMLAGFAFRAALTVRPNYTPRWWGLFFARQMERLSPFAKRGCVGPTAYRTIRSFFGKVAALNGPAQALGQDIREGILAAFEDANRAGGVNGRKLELKSIDDSYEPEKTIVATNNASENRGDDRAIEQCRQ